MGSRWLTNTAIKAIVAVPAATALDKLPVAEEAEAGTKAMYATPIGTASLVKNAVTEPATTATLAALSRSETNNSSN
jgi:hypothetical protein